MESKQQILEQVKKYLQVSPAQEERTKALVEFINETIEADELIDRKNFKGHITASAFIVSPALDSLLLLKHKSLGKWLQPGGHIDATDLNLAAAAKREAEEETGLIGEMMEIVNGDSIFDIDTHFIPENCRKNEEQHYHHDVRFLFTCKKITALQISEAESTAWKWVPLAALVDDAEFGEIAARIQVALKGVF